MRSQTLLKKKGTPLAEVPNPTKKGTPLAEVPNAIKKIKDILAEVPKHTKKMTSLAEVPNPFTKKGHHWLRSPILREEVKRDKTAIG